MIHDENLDLIIVRTTEDKVVNFRVLKGDGVNHRDIETERGCDTESLFFGCSLTYRSGRH
jgi:hypothetical protein